jgi:RNA polymerase sigma-70 factor (ECF subfamily)
MPFDDCTLVDRCRRGDQDAFEELAKRYSPRIFRIINRFFRDPAIVEDIAQEVFRKVCRSLHTYAGKSPFENWASAIILNTCYQQLDERRRRENIFLAEPEIAERLALDAFCLTPGNENSADPEQKALLRDLVEKIVRQLLPKERMILTLMEVEGLTAEGIARLWGMSRVSVKVRAYRARKHALKIFKTLAKTPQQL